MNWQAVGKMFAYVLIPGIVVLVIFTELTGSKFFVMPNIGYWVWIAFCCWVGWKANKWFPAKK